MAPPCAAIGTMVAITIDPGKARRARSIRGVILMRLMRTKPETRHRSVAIIIQKIASAAPHGPARPSPPFIPATLRRLLRQELPQR